MVGALRLGRHADVRGRPARRPQALWPEVREIAGARETLQELAGDCRLGIVTNASVSTRNMIEIALGRVGMRSLISEIFCYTEMGVRKDNPAFWRQVLDLTQADPARVVVVGDTLEQDVIGPREAGLFSVWFDASGSGAPQTYPVIHELADLVPIVRALKAQDR
jgi:haloacid dehalogenase superfamily, subfamily IA, variant 1 with third motif having Dx(3-4)D or Dx(3-4)E